ncbi:MAG: hypothetical protein LR015_06095 [Verrucomicrobia bacterium]|nr:hypothetical protein [Verrucomicrobiota bacterium]
MFAATDVAIGKRLKQSFYDLSVVPTVQSSAYDPEFDQHFYVILEHGHVHIIAATKSTDSVGRSRFPLFAALSIEREDAGLLSFDALQLGIEWLRVGV